MRLRHRGKRCVGRSLLRHEASQTQLQLLPGRAERERLSFSGVAVLQLAEPAERVPIDMQGHDVHDIHEPLSELMAGRGFHGGALRRCPLPTASPVRADGNTRQDRAGGSHVRGRRRVLALLVDGRPRAQRFERHSMSVSARIDQRDQRLQQRGHDRGDGFAVLRDRVAERGDLRDSVASSDCPPHHDARGRRRRSASACRGLLAD